MSGPTTVRKVALLGAESSGKTTLAEALAAHYQTVWVPEYLREFVDTHQRVPFEHEQVHIAQTQLEREQRALPQARGFLFCDTTPVMTEIYSRYCFGRPDAAVATLAMQAKYDFTFICAPDGPWVPDGLQRVSDAVRQDIHREVVRTLLRMGIDYVHISGTLEERMAEVTALLAGR